MLSNANYSWKKEMVEILLGGRDWSTICSSRTTYPEKKSNTHPPYSHNQKRGLIILWPLSSTSHNRLLENFILTCSNSFVFPPQWVLGVPQMNPPSVKMLEGGICWAYFSTTTTAHCHRSKKKASAIDVRDLKDPLAGRHEGQPHAGLWRTSFPPQPRCWPNPDNWSPKEVWCFWPKTSHSLWKHQWLSP